MTVFKMTTTLYQEASYLYYVYTGMFYLVALELFFSTHSY